jgi:3-oxoacyl-(acyl-carrier-protein) synthase
VVDIKAYIAGMGVVSPAGRGIKSLKSWMKQGGRRIRPLNLFAVPSENLLPVGEVSESFEVLEIPRAHQLAFAATQEAMAGSQAPPDAVIIGVTTGGILTTEMHLKNRVSDPEAFAYHAVGSVAEYIAGKYYCKGPVITVSNACSSGTAAIKIALEMLRSGQARRVLVGGVDSLCRLTYYGFKSLQLIDPEGARPLDQDRRGMSVGEAAAMILLVADKATPDNSIIEILGGGLSCDAYHPTSPHPNGEGALNAMRAAIRDAGISPSDIDYINLHGTGTLDNDLSEAKALKSLFGDNLPPLSSVKGAFGHSLGAAGAVEAVISAISISEGIIPANTGCQTPDQKLGLDPVLEPIEKKVRIVLSNSFGFGGNNAALVMGKYREKKPVPTKKKPTLTIEGSAIITGVGDIKKTLEHISAGKDCQGTSPLSEISKSLQPSVIRRLKRLPRMALALALAACKNANLQETPSSVFLGTGWGPLSETYDFLKKLYESDEKFTSPTDFIGSVHNAPAGQVAISLGANGPNITTTGGDYSFEQSLLTASILADKIDAAFLVIGADEFHETLSPLFDRSVKVDGIRSDGGGAICLKRSDVSCGPKICSVFFENTADNPNIIQTLIGKLGDSREIEKRFGTIMAGIPAAYRQEGERQLHEFLAVSDFHQPVIDYRRLTGEFASASAVATALAAEFIRNKKIPASLCDGDDYSLNGKGILIVGFGKLVTAIEITP